jgi:glycosyltransferase involved in cell wall biosynthesis
MSDKTVSFNMIVKNAADHVLRSLDSISRLDIDEVVIVDTGSTDGTFDLVKPFCDSLLRWIDPEPVVVDEHEFTSDFAAARNMARQASKGDYIFWIDSDDTILNPDGLRAFIDEIVRTGQFAQASMMYDYGHDDHGICVYRHPTVRFFLREHYRWKSPIHEVPCCLHGKPANIHVPDDVSRIIHEAKEVDNPIKSRRNAEVARRLIETGHPEREPRIWYNYGKSLRAIGEHEKAIENLRRYTVISGVEDETYHSWLLIGDSYFKLGEVNAAKDAVFQAVKTCPRHKESYIELSKIYFAGDEFENAEYWAKFACEIADSNSCKRVNPLSLRVGGTRILAMCAFEKHDYQKAYDLFSECLEAYPYDKEAQQAKLKCVQLQKTHTLIDGFKALEETLSREGDGEKSECLMRSVPKVLENRPEIKVPVRVEGDERPRLAIYCGGAPEPWGYDSPRKGGVGGSETAVVYMSEGLAKLGWRVEVYGWPRTDQDGERNGVLWFPHHRYEAAPSPDIFVSWRIPEAGMLEPHTRLKYCWLHDMQFQNRWRNGIVDEYKSVIVLSKFHRQNVSYIPDDKIWISANGLDSSFFMDGPNTSTRLVYASCPSRGLQVLLEQWAQIKERVPEAELDCYYGFNKWFLASMKTNEYYQKTYEVVTSGLNQPGVNWHGRVDQQELAKAFAASGIWAYPTSFPEISCITAMQAQANGSFPVCTRYAALDETVKFGETVGDVSGRPEEDEELKQAWVDKLVATMQSPPDYRDEMKTWARTNFLWSKVAESWDKRFRSDLSHLNSPISMTPPPLVTS